MPTVPASVQVIRVLVSSDRLQNSACKKTGTSTGTDNPSTYASHQRDRHVTASVKGGTRLCVVGRFPRSRNKLISLTTAESRIDHSVVWYQSPSWRLGAVPVLVPVSSLYAYYYVWPILSFLFLSSPPFWWPLTPSLLSG
jgi:hypothetical protein